MASNSPSAPGMAIAPPDETKRSIVPEDTTIGADSLRVPYAVRAMLENELNNLWQRIQAQPDTYVMTKEEFALFNYSRHHRGENYVAQNAITRFWDQYQANLPSEDRAKLTEINTSHSSKVPPPGYTGPKRLSTAWQDSLLERCRQLDLSPPTYKITSDRRGGRTAWSCTVSAGDRTFPARYWYDGQYVNNAKEDAAEIAWKGLQDLMPEYLLKKASREESNASMLRLNLTKFFGKDHANEVAGSSDRWSESASEETSLFESEGRGQLQTFFNPDTGEAYILTPRTSIHSDNGEADPMSVLEPTNEEAAQSVSDLCGLSETNAEGLDREAIDDGLEKRAESDSTVATRVFNKAVPAEARISPSKKVSFVEDEENVRVAKLNSPHVEPRSSNKEQVVKGRDAENLHNDNDDNHDGQQGRESDHISIRDYVALITPGRFSFRDLVKGMTMIRGALSYLLDHLEISVLGYIQKLGSALGASLSDFPILESALGASQSDFPILVNPMKVFLEDLTSASWDWWPFCPSFRPLEPNMSRIQWCCASGHAHWSHIPGDIEYLLRTSKWQSIQGATVSKLEVSLAQGSTPTAAPDEISSTTSSETSDSQCNANQSSPITSDNDSSNQRNSSIDSEKGTDSDSDDEQAPETSVTLDIIAPSMMKGFVLFGVDGSKRLRSARTRLAQIDVEACKDDDSFFDELAVQYKKLRGFFRWSFSVWKFRTCEFVRFYKANPNEILTGPQELPPSTDTDYQFNACRDPPIMATVFENSFYGCKKACIKSQLDILSLFHECLGRNHCGKHRVLGRLPKRQKKWEIDRDEEKDEAWGLNAVFGISFCKVFMYHLLILTGPLISWGIWLRSWPTDWQNASVPFFAVVMLLSLFWFPLTHDSKQISGERKYGNKQD